MASFSENAWDALNGALSICRGQMAGPSTTMGHLRDGRSGGEPGSQLADGQSADAARNRPIALSGRAEHLTFVICDMQRDPRSDSGVRDRQLARSRHLAQCTICWRRFPLLMLKRVVGRPSWLR